MLWIEASSIPIGVVYFHAVRNRPIEVFPHQDMKHLWLPVFEHLPKVTIVVQLVGGLNEATIVVNQSLYRS